MPEKKFAFKAGGPKRLTLRSTILGGKQDVYIDDRLIGSPTRRELAQGWRKSAGSSELYIRRLYGGWDVRMNGQPIADSYSHPVKRAQVASNVNFFVVVMSLLFAGIVASMTRLSTPLDWIEVIVIVIIALIYAILGWLIRTRLSAVALGISIALFLIDSVAVLLAVLAILNPTGVIGAFMVRFILFNQLIAGVGPLVEHWRARRVGERAAPDYALEHVFGRMNNAQRTKFLAASAVLLLFTIVGSIFMLPGGGLDDMVTPAVVLAPTPVMTPMPTATIVPMPVVPPTWTTMPMDEATAAALLTLTRPPTWTPTPTVVYDPAAIPLQYPAHRVLYDGASNRVFGLHARDNPTIAQLWWIDMTTQQPGVMPTAGVGEEMCVHRRTNLLYVITQQTGVIQVFDPRTNTIVQTVDWVEKASFQPGDPPQPYDITCADDRLYMTDSQSLPGIWTLDPLDLTATPRHFTLEPFSVDGVVVEGGFGGYTFGGDNRRLFLWTQASNQTPYVMRAQLDASRFVAEDVYSPRADEDGFREFPMNAPVFYDINWQQVVTRRAIFASYDLQTPLFMLPLDADRPDLEEVFSTVNFRQGFAASHARVVNLTDFSTRTLPSGVDHVFFGSDGRLYMVDNDAMMLTRLDLSNP